LLDFMPPHKFNQILASCNKIILNQHRSQGGASVWSALMRNADLYLVPKNPFYDLLTKRGTTIFKIENNTIDIQKTLSPEQKEENKQILLAHFSDEKVADRYRNLVK
ncbi:MAG: hypothetical protein MK212_22065, partial [Saprospiraceae bacterium]|nr:hypothetical protein [Saprospiraceae bacterium]